MRTTFDWSSYIDDLKQGKEGSEQILYEKLYPMVHEAALCHCGYDESKASFLEQEIFDQIFSDTSAIPDTYQFDDWARQKAETTCLKLNQWKEAGRVMDDPALPEVTSKDEASRRVVSNEKAILSRIDLKKKDLFQVLAYIFYDIPGIQASCIRLRQEGYSFSKIGDMFGISQDEAHMQVTYAKKHVKAAVLELEKHGADLYGLPTITWFYALLKKAAEMERKSAPADAEESYKHYKARTTPPEERKKKLDKAFLAATEENTAVLERIFQEEEAAKAGASGSGDVEESAEGAGEAQASGDAGKALEDSENAAASGSEPGALEDASEPGSETEASEDAAASGSASGSTEENADDGLEMIDLFPDTDETASETGEHVPGEDSGEPGSGSEFGNDAGTPAESAGSESEADEPEPGAVEPGAEEDGFQEQAAEGQEELPDIIQAADVPSYEGAAEQVTILEVGSGVELGGKTPWAVPASEADFDKDALAGEVRFLEKEAKASVTEEKTSEKEEADAPEEKAEAPETEKEEEKPAEEPVEKSSESETEETPEEESVEEDSEPEVEEATEEEASESEGKEEPVEENAEPEEVEETSGSTPVEEPIEEPSEPEETAEEPEPEVEETSDEVPETESEEEKPEEASVEETSEPEPAEESVEETVEESSEPEVEEPAEEEAPETENEEESAAEEQMEETTEPEPVEEPTEEPVVESSEQETEEAQEQESVEEVSEPETEEVPVEETTEEVSEPGAEETTEEAPESDQEAPASEDVLPETEKDVSQESEEGTPQETEESIPQESEEGVQPETEEPTQPARELVDDYDLPAFTETPDEEEENSFFADQNQEKQEVDMLEDEEEEKPLHRRASFWIVLCTAVAAALILFLTLGRSLIPAGSTSTKTAQEAANDVAEEIAGLASSDAADYSSLFVSGTDDATVQKYADAFAAADLSQYANDNAKIVYEGNGVYGLNLDYYSVSGPAPGKTVSDSAFLLPLVEEGGEWKIDPSKQEEVDNYTSTDSSFYSEDYLQAKEDGRNAALLSDDVYYYNNSEDYYSGTASAKPVFAWQQDDGSVMAGIWLANGTSSTVRYSDFRLSMTGDNGKIFTAKGTFNSEQVDSGEGEVVYIKIPASKVKTGTDKWENAKAKITVTVQ